MKVLIDTHILLWVLMDRSKLQKWELSILNDIQHDIFVSHITLWEISLKYSLGKLILEKLTPKDIPFYISRMGFKIAPITNQDVANFYQLPRLGNKDPFDRMLLWQAIQRDLYFMSRDKSCRFYEKAGLKISQIL